MKKNNILKTTITGNEYMEYIDIPGIESNELWFMDNGLSKKYYEAMRRFDSHRDYGSTGGIFAIKAKDGGFIFSIQSPQSGSYTPLANYFSN
jgi:hypothetical protein